MSDDPKFIEGFLYGTEMASLLAKRCAADWAVGLDGSEALSRLAWLLSESNKEAGLSEESRKGVERDYRRGMALIDAMLETEGTSQ